MSLVNTLSGSTDVSARFHRMICSVGAPQSLSHASQCLLDGLMDKVALMSEPELTHGHDNMIFPSKKRI